MRQLYSLINGAIRLLSMCIAFGVLSGQARAEAPNSITALSVSSAAAGATIIKVELAQPLSSPPVGFTINTPPRIALDFPNTANGLGKSVQEFAEGDLRSANIVQAGSRTRLVINLSQMVAYETRVEGNSLLISLRGKPVDAGQAVSTSRFPESKQDVQKHTLRDIDFRRGKNGEGRVQIDLSDPGVGIDIHQQGATLIVDFLKTSLPRNLQRKLDVTDFATPVQGIDTFAQGDSVRMVVQPKGQWEHAAYQTDNKFIIEVKPVVEDPNKLAKGGKTGYVGEKLTLNFQKIDVREALNVIADFTDMNMVISDTVSGNLTLRLKDVPWDQAFDIILQSRGLDMRKNGNVIQVAPRDEIAAKEKIDLTARQEISELEELRTESYQLSYQKGDAVVAILSNDKQRILSKRGSVVVDPRTNTLFIQDTPSRLEDVRKMIKQIDVPVRQVMIEARFVSAGTSFTQSLGGKLGYAGPAVAANGGAALGSNTPTATRVALGNSGSVNLPGAASGGVLALSLFNPAATKVLSLELAASEVDGKTKNIASPRVITADKKEASISSGTQIPYQQATSSGATSTAFIPATLSLKVTPQITPDDHVNMKVDATQDTVGANLGGGSVPSINSKKVATEVLVENGGTVVIGGVFTQDVSDAVNKVPVLGDVPVLGWLFKNNTKSDNKTELLIFITPKIMNDALNMN
ncbi:MAG: type IV pilus secretin PilQ [Nitrosomonadales bacterium]|nr:type IV pilus secretin PilQ [Nitrosomonadales bacterium]